MAVLLLFVLHCCVFFYVKSNTTQTAFKSSPGPPIVSNSTESPREPVKWRRPPPASLQPSCVLQLSSTNKLGGSHARFIFYTRAIRFEVPPAPATHNFLRLLPSFVFFFHPRLFPTFLCCFWGDDKEAGTVFICSLWIRRRDGILKRTFLIGFHQADRQFKIRTKEADKATVWFFFSAQSLFVGQIKLKREKDGCYFPDGVLIALCAATR